MLKKVLLVGALALGLSAAAFANGTADENVAAVPQFNPGIYGGVQLGYALTGWKTMWNAGDVVNVNKANSFAGRVYAGYDFHKNFALEAGYFLAFSKAKPRNLTGTADAANILTQAADLLVKVKIPLADSWGIYTKVGLGYLTSKVRDVTAGYALNSAKNFNVVYGAGVNYDITSNWATDLSWLHYTGNTNVNSKNFQPSLNFFALGISYKFNF